MSRKAPKKSNKVKTIGMWIVFLTIFISELFLYAWCRVQYIGVGYDILNASRYHQELVALQNNLKIELASLKSPDRIAAIAKKQLGLDTPKPEQMIIVP
ncbi:MAG: cell division protein FtsL [Desulfobacterales bacterium]|nr:MAG: cell division protein FtsL [Desulfobacterales bacterium]